MKGSVSAQDPQNQVPCQREEQRTWDKRLRQEMGDNGEGEGNKREGKRIFVSVGWRTALDREETDVAYRKMVVYKGKRGNLLLV